MIWEKKGVIFSVPNNRAQSPTAILLGRIIRIYYSSRIDGKSRIFYIDVDAETLRVTDRRPVLVLSPGEPGSFDENGCVPGSVVHTEDGYISLFYTGFAAGQNGNAYSLNVCQANSTDGGETFTKSAMPLIAGDEEKCYIAASPYGFMKDDELRLFYSVGTGWYEGSPVYKMNFGGFFNYDNQESTARPAIVKIGEKYCMWFSRRYSVDFRGGIGSYRIGYAEISDEFDGWQRDDSEAGIDVGEAGEFDDSMIAYPSIVRVKDRLIMFYSGNGFGETGIGCAVCEL